MNSPDHTHLASFIKIDRQNTAPVYIQVAQQIINAIQRGVLPAGTALPGSRPLSKLLCLHRNTVVAAYDELASQGWIEIRPNKGSFVVQPKREKPRLFSPPNASTLNYSEQTGFHFYQPHHLTPPYETTKASYTFNDGQPDIRLLSVSNLSRWYTAAMKRKSVVKQRFSLQESSIYEKQLCNYLNATRGFHISSKNILTTRSTDMSLYLISQLLIQPGDIVLVGTPSYFSANMIFHQAGAQIKTIPVDENGLDVEYIRQNFQKNSIRCLYCTPHRHYPTTATLSAERRLELTTLARDYGFALIEDDFDYDFQYDTFPMVPMATADTDGMIIYLGRFGQSLLPAFQTGFVIAPENLILAAKNYRQMIDKQGDFILEHALAEMIYEGEIYRLLKKSVKTYKERRDLFCEQLETTFGKLLQWEKPNGGLAVWINFTLPVSLAQLAQEAQKNDLDLPKYLLYQDQKNCGLRLGFGHLNEEEIPEVISRLKKAYDAVI